MTGDNPFYIHLKALFAAVVAFLSGLVTVLVGDSNLSDLTAAQWVTIALATVLALGGVYQLGPPVQRDGTTTPPSGGGG